MTQMPLLHEAEKSLKAGYTSKIIEENKKLQQQLSSLRKQSAKIRCFKTTIDASNQAIIWLDPNARFRIIYANAAACQHFGYSKGSLKASTLFDIMPQASIAQAIQENWIQNRLSNEGTFATIHRRSDGIFLPVEVTTTLFHYLRKPCIAYYIRDISRQKEAEEQLLKNLEQERELSHMKTLFVKIISHEFRTPLASLQTAVDLFENYEEKMSTSQKNEIFKNIKMSIQRMAHIMEDVLVLGKLQSNQVRYEPKPISIKDFIKRVQKEMEVAFPKRHISVKEKGILPTFLAVDEHLLYHILTNLISNGLKYSPKDSAVELIGYYRDPHLFFEVKDSGIGIPKRDYAHLFELFHRCSNVTNVRGAGVGLFLVKRCVELHNGAITFQSKENMGTTFSVKIPCKI